MTPNVFPLDAAVGSYRVISGGPDDNRGLVAQLVDAIAICHGSVVFIPREAAQPLKGHTGGDTIAVQRGALEDVVGLVRKMPGNDDGKQAVLETLENMLKGGGT